MPNKTEWVTQLDVIIGAETLSESQKAYRLSQPVWLDPALETLRETNHKDGISYVVSIAGYKYKFYHPDDCWKFSIVRDRAYCDYLYFRGMVETDGLVWESGDVSVYKEVNRK